MAYLYRHIREDKNVPFYIGIGNDDKGHYTRANQFGKYQRNKIWTSIYNKTNIKVHIMLDNLSWDDIKEKEKEFIMLYGRIDLGTGTLCNLTDGGDGTVNFKFIKTEEHKKKLFLNNFWRNASVEEQEIVRKKISENGLGKNKGKNPQANFTIEEKILQSQRISAQWKGKPKSKEHRLKISLGNKGKNIGKKASINTRQKMSVAQSGENNGFYGKKHSEETLEKMRGRKRSEETRLKISLAKKGKPSPKKGKRLSGEQLKINRI